MIQQQLRFKSIPLSILSCPTWGQYMYRARLPARDASCLPSRRNLAKQAREYRLPPESAFTQLAFLSTSISVEAVVLVLLLLLLRRCSSSSSPLRRMDQKFPRKRQSSAKWEVFWWGTDHPFPRHTDYDDDDDDIKDDNKGEYLLIHPQEADWSSLEYI